MDLWQAMETRHSVRSYTTKKLEGEVLEQLQEAVAQCNLESGLSIQLCIDAPEAFSGGMARYGKFRNVGNYIALVGKKGPELEEKCGYYGEKLVLKAAQLGLHTCWVAMSYSKGKNSAKIGPGEKCLMVISLGYGENEGVPHKSKPLEALYQADGPLPQWFRRGVEAAQLAPTAMNQQKFRFVLEGNTVSAQPGRGFYTKTDLGIAKYHFEIGAGDGDWRWA